MTSKWNVKSPVVSPGLPLQFHSLHIVLFAGSWNSEPISLPCCTSESRLLSTIRGASTKSQSIYYNYRTQPKISPSNQQHHAKATTSHPSTSITLKQPSIMIQSIRIYYTHSTTPTCQVYFYPPCLHNHSSGTQPNYTI